MGVAMVSAASFRARDASNSPLAEMTLMEKYEKNNCSRHDIDVVLRSALKTYLS